jgi:hypothetical protein
MPINYKPASGSGATGDALKADKLSQFAATTSAELAGVITDETGTGAAVLATSPTLVTPALGTPTALVGTNITGTGASFTAGTVSDNAITLAKMAPGTDGNIISYDASGDPVAIATGTDGQVLTSTGAGSPPAFENAATGDALVANPLSQFAATTSAQLAGVISNETGSGSLVFGTSPTLVTPALGTPSALVGTSISGTGASFTAGNVTTNANLTGHITSSGNAAVLGSFTSAQLSTALTNETGSGAAVFGTSPALSTPTGIVKGDVGLGNVDNTSDATKDAASATLTNKTLTSPALTGSVSLADAANVHISVPLLAGTDHTTTGITATMLAGGAISAFDLVCIHSTTQEVVEADASAIATARVIGIAPAAISDTASGIILLHGFVRDDTWAWTTGGVLYLSETAGAMTHTAPTTSGAFVQAVGIALSPVVVYINPSLDVIEHA